MYTFPSILVFENRLSSIAHFLTNDLFFLVLNCSTVLLLIWATAPTTLLVNCFQDSLSQFLPIPGSCQLPDPTLPHILLRHHKESENRSKKPLTVSPLVPYSHV